MSEDKKIIMYTDGACRNNPGPGGWGVVLIYGEHTKKLSGSVASTTNNRMELTAAIEGLANLKRHCQVDLFTDSQYVKNGVEKWVAKWKANGWRSSTKKPVKNQDLWEQLEAQLQQHQVSWHWVKGHSGNVYNDEADRLANVAIDKMLGMDDE